MKKLNNHQWAFFVARITIGINLLLHGLVRIPKLSKFAEGLTKEFSETYLPQVFVSPFAHVLPFIELLLGILLVLGWKTKFATIASALLITVLLFGMSMQEDWGGVGNLMVYAIFFFLLIKNLEHNAISFDAKSRTKVDGFQ
ncbi:MauE/DoxX family redox-associated membrane protein [Rasiella sp. SM2506]|uniref:MauE/DoxX family redox-associated membrane protein n=1 Tax=Rasiella sp. SM2506 TaxID=3423914 RepID=UPI003D79F740